MLFEEDYIRYDCILLINRMMCLQIKVAQISLICLELHVMAITGEFFMEVNLIADNLVTSNDLACFGLFHVFFTVLVKFL